MLFYIHLFKDNIYIHILYNISLPLAAQCGMFAMSHCRPQTSRSHLWSGHVDVVAQALPLPLMFFPLACWYWLLRKLRKDKCMSLCVCVCPTRGYNETIVWKIRMTWSTSPQCFVHGVLQFGGRKLLAVVKPPTGCRFLLLNLNRLYSHVNEFFFYYDTKLYHWYQEFALISSDFKV